uniref:HpcH/HpaI aldolase family protein n=1 Tax=Enterocloster hominis (ex Hitch et al. 2024) TaxID=1917870 RepID=UPI00102FB510|nr:aldolase/citrate lyase family protein [Lachnoclostridium pacaense]
MKDNKIRALLLKGNPTTSTRLWSSWPLYTELVGTTDNFDYIELVAEYTPLTQSDLENVARAAELHGMGSMIKVDFQNRGYVAQKAVGAGFQAILFADHHTPDEVRESIRMIKPDRMGEGRFGYPNRRFIGAQTHISQLEHAKRLDEIVLAFMIEKAEAMEYIEEICAIPGVDMVQFGPSDYSMSLGKDRDEYEAEYKAAERKMIAAAQKYGVSPRCEIQSPEEAQYYIDLGVKHFSLGDQFKVLRKYWVEEGARLRKMADLL